MRLIPSFYKYKNFIGKFGQKNGKKLNCFLTECRKITYIVNP